MDPRQFLDLAGEWAAGAREGEWRSASSRAYYAAFHVARRALLRMGFSPPVAERGHAYLWMRLSNAGHPTVSRAGHLLHALRRRRNRADYDLDRTFPERFADDDVNTAIEIVQLLEALLQDATTLAQVTAAVRAYERDVLGEVTWQGP